MPIVTKNLPCCSNKSYYFAFIVSYLLSIFTVNGEANVTQSTSNWENNEEIELFRQYLRIPTVQPHVNYEPAVEFLKNQARSLNLPVSIYYQDAENPVVVMTWKGFQPELPAIILNSHMDVVPVFEEYWTHPPFAAEIDENGNIYARGAQDMKSVGMWYLAAIRALKRSGVDRLKRTIHIVYVPDEEKHGARGMAKFCKSAEFQALNAVFVLDEGGTPIDKDSETLPAYYSERILWRIEYTFRGQSGHGSKLFDSTSGEKFNYVLGKMSEYRANEKKKLDKLKYPEGNVTAINLTIIKGGVANNVIPPEFTATFDMRLAQNTDMYAFEQQIKQWCDEAGENITVKNIVKDEMGGATRVDDLNPFWVAFKNGVNQAGLKVKPAILPQSSDMRFIRHLNISAIGFSPLVDTIERAHDHDEYLNANVYLSGIGVYEKLIKNLAIV